MKQSIKNLIYQAISLNKWLNISYINKKGETTYYYIATKNIDVAKEVLLCDIFNPYKKDETLETYIYVKNILSASILEHSYYEPPKDLLKAINENQTIANYLEVSNFDNNILSYLSDCYRLDNDPYLKEFVTIDGIDTHTLLEKSKYNLDDDQFNKILNDVFKKNKYEAEKINRYQTLAINKFSIDINDKQYVVAYRVLTLNFKDKTLKISSKSSINKSFLLSEDSRVSLNMYLDVDQEEFIKTYDDNERYYIEQIKENFHHGEKVNTRPTIFFLMRNSIKGVDEAFEAIHEMDVSSKLSFPLKSFFGRNRSKPNHSKEINLVVFNKSKINIDQVRVVYNSLINPVTYVKGPPGTGKTETIFNVLLSSYANDKTVLVCSNNNHPVNDIFKKMDDSLTFTNYYTNKEEKIFFPMIRLGNSNEMVESIKRLRSILKYVNDHININLKEEATEKSKNRSLSSFQELKKLITEYESQVELKERLNSLEKIRTFTTIDKINIKLDQQIKEYKSLLSTSNLVKEEDVLKYTSSASEDKNFQNYLYYSSQIRFKKLLSPTYKELKDIILEDDIDKAAVDLSKYIKDDLNLRRLLAIFPVVISTNLSCEKLGSPKPQFDLVIMDEAGQCNVATSLIPIIRGNSLLLVGDTNQLQPVTVLDQSINEKLMEKYGIKDEYNYIKNSILSTMLRKDNNSKNILLRYHYRCGNKIANFVNQRFYNDQLKLLNRKEGSLVYCNVKNETSLNSRNAYIEEAQEIAKIIKDNNYKDVGIITPFVNQANLINFHLQKEGIKDVKAGTIHTLQGSEKSVIIMSSALSPKTSKKTMDWIKNNHELINVAVTRAKNKFIFVGDKEAIDTLSKNEDNDIKTLSDYVYKNGEVAVQKSDAIISYDFSNDSKNEKDFFETIKPYFNRRGTKFRIEKNVKVKDAIKDAIESDFNIFKKKEFDIVVQVSDSLLIRRYRTIVVFEIDGGEHIGSKRTSSLDRQKEAICKKYKIKLIRIPNSAVKDYESIISLFEFVIKDLNNIEEAYTQISLFDLD